MEPVCGDGSGVHCAVFILAHPLGAQPEQVHPVLLGNALRESRDTGTCQCMDGRCLHDTLPLLDMRIGAAVKEQKVGKRKHILSHLGIATEHLLKVIRKASCLGDIVQESSRTVHPVKIATVILHGTTMPRPGQRLNLGQVPV